MPTDIDITTMESFDDQDQLLEVRTLLNQIIDIAKVNDLTELGSYTSWMYISVLTGNNVRKFGIDNLPFIKATVANTFTVNQTFNKEIILASTPWDDHKASWPTTSVTAGASVSQFNVCQLQADGKFDPADSSTASSANANWMLALSLEAKTDTQAMKVALTWCFVRDDTWTWTVWWVIYLWTSGAMTQTAPTTSWHTVRVLWYALTADVVYFNPSPDYIELS